MNRKDDIKNELNELKSSLPSASDGSPYGVPEGYFEGLAASVLARVKSGSASSEAQKELEGLSPLLAGLSRSMPYSMPQGYFDSNIENLEAFTREEDSLILSFVDKEAPYQVPTGYFAGLADQVLEKVQVQAKVVPMYKRKWLRMAVAAMLIGIVTLTGISYFNQGSGTTGKDPVAVEIDKASTEELDAFIKTTDVILSDDRVTAQNGTDVQQLLKDVSDTELEAFLDQVPTDDEEGFDIN